MNTSIRWEEITTGATFQALLSGLVLHLDAKARVFSRPGRDGGLDGLSGDGLTIYQAKFAASRRLAGIALKQEVKKIVRYRSDPKSSGYARWKGISKWTLATNVTWGPSDEDAWQEGVKPLEEIGLECECWYDEPLADRIRRYPDLGRAFFGGAPRAFLSLPEAFVQLLRFEPNEKAIDLNFRGRGEAFEAFDRFFQGSHRAIALHGQGGVGKSRLLLEVGHWALEQGFVEDVYWAVPDVLAASGEWYGGLVPERRILILLDEPDDPKIVRRLLREVSIGTGRAGQWRVAVAVRTPNDPVLAPLRDPRDRLLAEPIELKPLAALDAEAVCRDLLAGVAKPEELDSLAKMVFRAVGGHPMWLSIAALLIERGLPLQHLPSEHGGLAAQYIEEIIAHFPESLASRAAVRDLMRWVGLLQPLNREDAEVARFVAQETGVADIGRVLAVLGDRRVVAGRGVRQRQISITPDVIKEKLLLDWLTFNEGSVRRVTQAGLRLADRLRELGAETMSTTALERGIHSLGRLQLINGIGDVLIGPFVEALAVGAGVASTAIEQASLLSLGTMYSPFHPARFSALVALLRTRATAPSTSEVAAVGDRTISHDDVVLKLAWPLFNAGLVAEPEQQAAVLEELVAVARAEEEIYQRTGVEPRRDGERAKDLLGRLLVSRTEAVHSYRAASLLVVGKILDRLGQVGADDLSAVEASVAETVLGPLLTAERVDHCAQEPHKLAFTRYFLDPSEDDAKTRARIREALWHVLERPGTLSARKLAIDLLVQSHQQANAAARTNHDAWGSELRDDLTSALSLMKAERLSKVEAFRARRIWDWHVRFEKDESIAAIARDCEAALIVRLGAVSELLLLNEEQQVQWKRLEELAEKRIDQSTEELANLFAEVAELEAEAGKEAWRFSPAMDFAIRLGERADRSETVRELLLRGTREGPKGLIFRWACAGARGWIDARRKSGSSERLNELFELLAETLDDPSFAGVFRELYVHAAPRSALTLQRDDLAFIAVAAARFRSEPATWCFAMGGTFPIDWERFAAASSGFIAGLDESGRATALRALMRGMHYRQIFADEASTGFGVRETEWLIDRIAELPDPGALLAYAAQEQLLRSRLKLEAFVQILERRHAMFSERERSTGEAVPAAVIPVGFEVGEMVDQVADPPTESERSALTRLLRFAGDEGSLGYMLPSIVSDLDSHGVVVPAIVAEEIQRLQGAATTARELWGWSRLAGWYRQGSPEWRRIAIEACRAAHAVGTEEALETVYASLRDHRPQSFSGFPGEVPAPFSADVSRASEALEKETDPDLRRYWERALAIAQARLEEQRGLIEERGW